MKTVDQEYEIVKAKFTALSKEKHLACGPYDAAFNLAADAVRSVFNVEPIYIGVKRSTIESRATQALVAIMKYQTDILDTHLAKLLGGKRDNVTVYKNFIQHKNAYATETKYRQRFNQALVNYVQSK